MAGKQRKFSEAGRFHQCFLGTYCAAWHQSTLPSMTRLFSGVFPTHDHLDSGVKWWKQKHIFLFFFRALASSLAFTNIIRFKYIFWRGLHGTQQGARAPPPTFWPLAKFKPTTCAARISIPTTRWGWWVSFQPPACFTPQKKQPSCCGYPPGNLTYPTKREKENHLQKWFLMGMLVPWRINRIATLSIWGKRPILSGNSKLCINARL